MYVLEAVGDLRKKEASATSREEEEGEQVSDTLRFFSLNFLGELTWSTIVFRSVPYSLEEEAISMSYPSRHDSSLRPTRSKERRTAYPM
jgi:hypothetical protein